jgi:RimJ/RimL family protein N-acetyltransferase
MRPPMLREIPTAFETERLLIRAHRPGDGAAVNEAVRESFAELKPWMPWAQAEPTVDESEEHARTACAHWIERTGLGLLLFLKGTDTLVGCSGLHGIDWKVPKFEIGYWCRTSFQGKGYITEAVRGITVFTFETLGARRVAIHCDARNERSRRVMVRAGYSLEAVLRNHEVAADGTVRDTVICSLIPEEYAALSLPPIRVPELEA